MNNAGSPGRRAIVVGGGIGGLATAVALGRAGWGVTVLEQAAAFWEAGAGLLVTPNGERALGVLGVHDAIVEAGHRVRIAGVKGTDGGWILSLPEAHEAYRGVGVHRRALHGALLDAASAVAETVTGARVVGLGVGAADRPANVAWRDVDGERSRDADLVVVADGARSDLRAQVVPSARLVPSGYSSWRSVVTDTELLGDVAVTWWGPGAEFAAQRIGPDRVSWQATYRHDAGVAFDDDLTSARALFGRWPDQVWGLVDATGAREIVRHELAEVHDVPTFVAGRVALLGDAAHAMVPQRLVAAQLRSRSRVDTGLAGSAMI